MRSLARVTPPHAADMRVADDGANAGDHGEADGGRAGYAEQLHADDRFGLHQLGAWPRARALCVDQQCGDALGQPAEPAVELWLDPHHHLFTGDTGETVIASRAGGRYCS